MFCSLCDNFNDLLIYFLQDVKSLDCLLVWLSVIFSDPFLLFFEWDTK